MRLSKLSRVALLGQMFVATLFVGVAWMAGGCEVEHDKVVHERVVDHDRPTDVHREVIIKHEHD